MLRLQLCFRARSVVLLIFPRLRLNKQKIVLFKHSDDRNSSQISDQLFLRTIYGKLCLFGRDPIEAKTASAVTHPNIDPQTYILAFCIRMKLYMY